MHGSHDDQQGLKPIISISIPPERRQAFYDALFRLKERENQAFLSASALIVKTIIEAAEQIKAEEKT